MSILVKQLTGGHVCAPRAHPRMYGIEVEAEYCNGIVGLSRLMGESWLVETDGSLRHNGVELISPPRALEAHVRYLPDVWAAMAASGCRATPRTGIHLHCDMSHQTLEEVGAVIAAYCIIEPMLFEICGPEREENIYCVPWYRAPDQAAIFLMAQASELASRAVNVLRRACKYSALYVEPLVRFGTIELRMPPTFETWQEMEDFMRTVDSLIKYALLQGTAAAVLERFDFIGDAAVWLGEVLGADRARALMDTYGDFDGMVYRTDSTFAARELVSSVVRTTPVDTRWRSIGLQVGPVSTVGAGRVSGPPHVREASRLGVNMPRWATVDETNDAVLTFPFLNNDGDQ